MAELSFQSRLSWSDGRPGTGQIATWPGGR
jgi:hypothetical protein